MFQVFTQSQKLSNSTANKIQAIQIAREGIEAVKNIRDTNWILFWSDTKSCWNTFNYNNTCVWDPAHLFRISWWNGPAAPNKKWYTISTNSDNRWELSPIIDNESNFTYSNSSFRSNFKVWYDTDWSYTQSSIVSETTPLFTRLIKFNYLDTDWDTFWDSRDDEKLRVRSIVEWSDNSSSNPHKVEFTTVLTNWK